MSLAEIWTLTDPKKIAKNQYIGRQPKKGSLTRPQEIHCKRPQLLINGAVSMGRRNTISKSTCRRLRS
jgi:hypothetical protein